MSKKTLVQYISSFLIALLIALPGCAHLEATEGERSPVADAPAVTQPSSLPTEAEPRETLPETASFTPGKHQRNETNSAAFNTYDATTDAFTLRVQDNGYTEILGQEIYAKVRADYLVLAGIFQIVAIPTFHVVLATIPSQPSVFGDQAYTSFESMVDNSYRSKLIAATLDLTEPWMVAGIEAYAFNDDSQGDDSAFLKDYYGDSANLDTLMLFGGYFISVFSDAGTESVARRTSVSFSRFIIDSYGAAALQNYDEDDGAKYCNEWLNSIGIDANCSPPNKLSKLDRTVYYATRQYPLVMEVGSHTLYFKKCETFADNTIVDMLYEFYSSIDSLLSYLETYAPENYPAILERWNQGIRYYFDETFAISGANVITNSVEISDGRDLLHEVVHLLVPESLIENQIWKSEGMTTYLSNLFYRTDAFFNFFSIDIESLVGDDRYFCQFVHDYYLDKAGVLPTGMNDYNLMLMSEAMAVCTVQNPELSTTVMVNSSVAERRVSAYDNYGLPIDKSINGNGLSYLEASLFIEYLAQQFGLDIVISFCNAENPEIEDYFSASYEELYSDFVDYCYVLSA